MLYFVVSLSTFTGNFYWEFVYGCNNVCIFKLYNSVSTLSQKSETVSQKWDWRRKVRLPPNSATVAVFCDSLTCVRQCGQGLRLNAVVAECKLPF